MSEMIDLLYDALSHAETGGEIDKWIRTNYNPPDKILADGTIKPVGSSAFGPVQITRALATNEGRFDAYFNQLTPETQKFIREVYNPMQQKMNKYGGEDMQPGFEQFDYGQSGGFDPQYRDEYEKMAKELIEMKWIQSGRNSNRLLELWKGNPNNAPLEKGYRQRFEDRLAKGNQ